jgi:hypothetical protein
MLPGSAFLVHVQSYQLSDSTIRMSVLSFQEKGKIKTVAADNLLSANNMVLSDDNTMLFADNTMSFADYTVLSANDMVLPANNMVL